MSERAFHGLLRFGLIAAIVLNLALCVWLVSRGMVSLLPGNLTAAVVAAFALVVVNLRGRP